MTIIMGGTGTPSNSLTGDSGASILMNGGSGLIVKGAYPAVLSPTTEGSLKVVISPMVLSSPISVTTPIFSVTSYSSFTPSGGVGTIAGNHVSFLKATPAGTAVAPSNSPTLLTAISMLNPGLEFKQGGIFSSSAGTTYSNSSDYRLKENVTPVENGLDYIMPLRPRKFTWKNSGMESIGFIAHELDEDFPPHIKNGLVTGEKDDFDTFVNLYKDGELLLNELNLPIVRELPRHEEAARLTDEGYTWVTVEEKPVLQQVSTRGLISPLVASVQQLNSLIVAQQAEIEELQLRIVTLKEKKNV